MICTAFYMFVWVTQEREVRNKEVDSKGVDSAPGLLSGYTYLFIVGFLYCTVVIGFVSENKNFDFYLVVYLRIKLRVSLDNEVV